VDEIAAPGILPATPTSLDKRPHRLERQRLPGFFFEYSLQ
jgi:hypothetical protein